MRNIRRFFFKCRHYEFWPWWAIFIPMLPVYVYSVIRSGKLLYFTAVNTGIPMGGFFGEHKDDILSQIPEQYKAKSYSVKRGAFKERLIEQGEFSFPLIVISCNQILNQLYSYFSPQIGISHCIFFITLTFRYM